MAVVKCEKGHYYDNVKFQNCPHCEEGLPNIKKESYIDDLSNLPTIAIPFEGHREETAREERTVDYSLNSKGVGDGVTVGVYSFVEGTQLLTGWLVATQGPARGKDYKLYHGWNRIGRSTTMNVYVPEDKRISYENHAAIVFNEKNMKFYIVSEMGALVYLNDIHMTDTKEIKDGDVIKLGDSELTFVAFCTEGRRW